MSQDSRRELISRNLGIKSINHGQVYAFQIVIPDSRKQTISLEQRQAIETSLLTHQTNLISLVIRRTDAYADEDIEYELVYGADWLQIAQELKFEKVWAWVFDLTDEQMLVTIAEMESLTNASTPTAVKKSDDGNSAIAALIDQKLQLSADSIKNLITSLLTGISNDLDEKLKVLNYRIDHLNSSIINLSGLETVLERLDTIQQQLASSRKVPSIIKPPENPINLLDASNQDIEAALRQVNAQSKQISAAIAAVQHWQQSEQGLSWKNLEISFRAKTGKQHKIDGFAKGTYNLLQKVAFIPGQDNAELFSRL